jgi:DNA-binding transcriptional ArsR family regulator
LGAIEDSTGANGAGFDKRFDFINCEYDLVFTNGIDARYCLPTLLIVGKLQAHVLLHPIRMRVVLALGSESLATKQIHQRLPDVAQASLYRAVSRLVEAGVIAEVERRRRGGAIERVYRVASRPESALVSGTPEEFVAAHDRRV